MTSAKPNTVAPQDPVDPSQAEERVADIQNALRRVEAACAERGIRLTKGRRNVLRILLGEQRALGAYEILDQMEPLQGRVLPPIVYRALRFLTEHGFAHKVERLNAYVACAQVCDGHAPAFLICRVCHLVEERHVPPDMDGLGRAAKESGFKIEHTIVEAEGLCPACASAQTA